MSSPCDPMKMKGPTRSILALGLLQAASFVLATEGQVRIGELAQTEHRLQARTQQPSAPTDGQQDRPPYTIAVESNLVVLDVLVTDEDGNVLAGLKKENFRVLDEGKPQVITSFGPTDDPITIVMVLEYSGLAYNYFATRGHIGVRDFSIISMRKIGSR